jgi:N-methylhydantoinase A
VRLGVDVGGTFTDLAALVDGRIVSAKVPSTPADQSLGVMRALAASGVAPRDVAAFAHGMTVATNALLERRGARTALVTTEGFRDVLEIGRQTRADLYDLTRAAPAPLVPRELRFTVRERMGPDGPLVALDDASVAAAVADLRAAGVQSVAVCLLFAFLHPEHERRVGEAVRAALPGVHVSLSSEVLPEVREYERFATTAADAYLAPVLGRYLEHLAARAREVGLAHPLVMQSSGGVVDLEAAAGLASTCVLSGPAGGVVGAGHAAAASGFANVLSFDMGGTSTDVAPIVGGKLQTRTDAVVAGVPLRHPMVDVHTVSAGGGSIAALDAGGALRVGPRSAGAEPGPAAYGRGGKEPTVTDANLVLGYLAGGARLGGEVVLDRERAHAALAALGAPAALDPVTTALGVVRVANAEMVRALRVISVERGLDPRDFALVAFGGAGGMHACALAEELGMDTVLVPRAGGVLSALGLAVSDLRRDYVRPLLSDLDALDASVWEEAFAAMEASARADLDDPGTTRLADLRYRRQAFELTVPADDLAGLRERFDAAHERHYGYRVAGEPIELVGVRLVATRGGTRPALREAATGDDGVAGTREINIDGTWVDARLHTRDRMGAGSAVEGPAVMEMGEATCLARPGWSGVVDDAGTLVLRRA